MNDAATTENIPITTINPSDDIAGCLAKINVPMPTNIINALIATLFLKDLRTRLPRAYSYIKPSVIKTA